MSQIALYPKVPRGTLKHREVKLASNLFEAKIDIQKLYQYALVFEPEMKNDIDRRIVVTTLFRQLNIENKIFYDGRNLCFSVLELDSVGEDKVTQSIPMPDSKSSVQLSLSRVNVISLADLNKMGETDSATILQGLDIILRDSMIKSWTHSDPYAASANSRSLFRINTKGFKLDRDKKQAITAFPGLYSSVRLLQRGPVVNIDTSWMIAIESCNLLDYLCEALNVDSPNKINPKHDIKRHLKGLRVRGTYGNRRKYGVMDIAKQSASAQMIDVEGAKISIEQYFQKTYQVKLKYPKLPCVVVNKEACIPMELLNIIPGQKPRTELDALQKAEFIGYTAGPPSERFNIINTLSSYFTLPYKPPTDSKASDQTILELMPANGVLDFKATSIKLNPKSLSVTGHILPEFEIVAKSKNAIASVPVKQNVWRLDDRNAGQSQFILPMNVQSSILIISKNARVSEESIKQLFGKLSDTGKKYGMTIAPPSKRFVVASGKEAAGEIEKLVKAKQIPTLIFGIIDNSDPIYQSVKRYCETSTAIVSQFFNSRKIFKINDMYIANILYKINVKLGGINFEAKTKKKLPSVYQGVPERVPLALSDKPTIVFGADVYHRTSGQAQSHAGITASQNFQGTSYAGFVMQQGIREEIIPSANLKMMARNFLSNYAKSTGTLPHRIIYLRDGDLGQRDEKFINQELGSIADGYHELATQKGYIKDPEFIMITCVKRHHFRFSSNNANPYAGTVVDENVVRKDVSEFYLVSHPPLKGTSRPTLYQVCVNNSKLNMDDLQEVIYYLTHLHQRSTRSVSSPAPVYYSHLLSYHARLFEADGYPENNTWPTKFNPQLFAKPFYL